MNDVHKQIDSLIVEMLSSLDALGAISEAEHMNLLKSWVKFYYYKTKKGHYKPRFKTKEATLRALWFMRELLLAVCDTEEVEE